MASIIRVKRSTGINHYQSHIAAAPAWGHAGDVLVEGQAEMGESLHLSCAGIGCVAQYERVAVRVGGERPDAVCTQIGRKRDRVDIPHIEAGPGVGRCCAADIPAFGVKNDGDLGRDGGQGGGQQFIALTAQRLVKSDVGFVGCGDIAGGGDDAPVPVQQVGITWRFARRVGIQADAEGGDALIKAGVEFVEKTIHEWA